MNQYFIVHKQRPRDALRVCRNSRSAEYVVEVLGEDYMVVDDVDRVINRVVSDLMPAVQVYGRLS